MLLLFCALLAMSSQPHQTNAATVSGVVTDQRGAVINEVKITFRNLKTKQSLSATTSQVGQYEIQLPPGTYSMSTEKPGFHPFRSTSIRVKKGDTKLVNVQLTTGIIDYVLVPPESQTGKPKR